MSGITRDEAISLVATSDLDSLMMRAAALRDAAHGRAISYSRKVFIPLTQLCRDSCHYCTFAHPPRRGERAYLDADQVLAIARAGAAAACIKAARSSQSASMRASSADNESPAAARSSNAR